jgi:membrane associated rhomboid family serine protease
MRLSGRRSSSSTRSWTQPQRVILVALIALNTCAFVAQLFLTAYDPEFGGEFLGLSKNGVESAYAWQFITAAVMHAGVWHFVGNTIVLYLLGRDVECILGQRHFLQLYICGALAGEFGHLFLMPADSVLFGASGGVAAVLMAYATILPELELTSTRLLLPFRLKAKHLAYAAGGVGVLLLFLDRSATVTHSVYLGGCGAGWLYAHLLGFGRPSRLQRVLHQRRATAERHEHMNAEQFIAEEVDPLLEKISREGIASLTRAERRILQRGREKLTAQR